MIKRLLEVFDRFVAKDTGSSEETGIEGSTQTFETPEMEEFLKENQTADEL